ncbi:tRNA(Ile)-lysidine synthetase [Mucinivorans hirudinis]|uniref:tRNA(Ile)-lysidine synthase n=1 Tax=Mucinivorans hirudinis TaxID=1433126 RepID=A0A060RBJ5_9BACT|nr:tRNA(Ile)-lysidine synthetase [Mucinivorans hirudinis]
MSAEKTLLAVSGGVDSMVMLDMYIKQGMAIGVAHCNFRLRGAESDAEQALVERVATKNNIPIYIRRFDTSCEAALAGESIQMAARRLRYAFFEEICTEQGYDKIAIAHHSDDSTETFFINLLRGTGLRGLTGISAVNGRVIRPLLGMSREQILEYAAENEVKYLLDSSNGSLKYLRNRLRHDIIPRLADSVPDFRRTMAQNLMRLEQAQNFIDNQIAEIRDEVISENIIDLGLIKSQGNYTFVIFELLRPYGFSPEVIEDLCRSTDSTGKQFYAAHWVATIDRGRVIMTERTRQLIEDELICETDERIEQVDVSRLMSLRTPANEALLCVDAAHFPLRVRRWQQGDWFVPLGLRGQKKVSDFLIDAKVSMPDKERQLVLMTGETIMWLIGRRIDDRFKVDEKSRRVIKIRL